MSGFFHCSFGKWRFPDSISETWFQNLRDEKFIPATGSQCSQATANKISRFISCFYSPIQWRLQWASLTSLMKHLFFFIFYKAFYLQFTVTISVSKLDLVEDLSQPFNPSPSSLITTKLDTALIHKYAWIFLKNMDVICLHVTHPTDPSSSHTCLEGAVLAPQRIIWLFVLIFSPIIICLCFAPSFLFAWFLILITLKAIEVIELPVFPHKETHCCSFLD